MTLSEAISTLQELVGRTTQVDFQARGVRVIGIDYFAHQQHRCILGRIIDNDIPGTLRRSVADITIEKRFYEADLVVAIAELNDIRAVIERQLEHQHRTP